MIVKRRASKRTLKWNAGVLGMDRWSAATAVLQMGKSI
jgi:hypothetical protein